MVGYIENITLTDYIFLYIRPLDLAWKIKHFFFPNARSVKASLKGRIRVEGQLGIFNFMEKEIRLECNGSTGPIDEIFLNEFYKLLDVKGAEVLDIGAAIGDTAIYFSMKGAHRITAYEQEKVLAESAQKNLRSNGISNAEVINETATSNTIDIFAKKNGIRKVLKIDCEGGEYDMILNAKRLKAYDQIMLEYHHGYLNLKGKLEGLGFKLNIGRPHLSSNGDITGYIHASNPHTVIS